MEDFSDFAIEMAAGHCAEIEKAIASGKEGVLFEDGFVIVERHAGRVYMTGKALKNVFMYDSRDVK